VRKYKRAILHLIIEMYSGNFISLLIDRILYEAQAGLVLLIPLLQPPACWDYRGILPHLAEPTFL
jgi:hypothetical protein